MGITRRELLNTNRIWAAIRFNPLAGALLTGKYRKEYCGEIQTLGGI
jgi:hypothetical protein